MRRWAVRLLVFAGMCLLAAGLLWSRPSPAAAGNLPCFICHGRQFQGSDLAPSVADTKLTDEQIFNQIRRPRGVMPAFPEFASQDIVNLIRTMPTGQPTATLSAADRSAGLALIAEAAAARATEYAQRAEKEAGQTPDAPQDAPANTSTPTPAPTSTPAPSGSSASLSSPSNPASPRMASPLLSYTLVGGVVVAFGVVLLVWRRLKE